MEYDNSARTTATSQAEGRLKVAIIGKRKKKNKKLKEILKKQDGSGGYGKMAKC